LIFVPVNIDTLFVPYREFKLGFSIVFSVAKPLFVDGSAKSHQLFLAYDKVSLSKLEPPLVLQEFVNHGELDYMYDLHFVSSF